MNASDALDRIRRTAGAVDLLGEVTGKMEALIDMVAGEGERFEIYEVIGLAAHQESERIVFARRLQKLADSYGDRITVDGHEHVVHQPGTVTYHSLNGPLVVTRATYRETGVHNGATVVPLELEAGLIEHATPALAKAVALGYAKHELRSVAEDLAAAHRSPPSRATLERIAVRLAVEAHEAAPRIEKRLRRREVVPEGACGVVLGLDRGSVPMAEARPAEREPATRRRKRTTPYVRTPPPPIDVNWRMAPVASVTITDAHGDAMVTRKYAATADDGWTGIIERAKADITGVLAQTPYLAVGIVQDGAHELWNLARAAMAAIPAVTSYVEGIDRYHLVERLGKVLQIIEPDPETRRRENERWNALLDTDAGGIDEIEKTILRAHRRLPVQEAAAVYEHIVYLRNNKDRMRYVVLANARLPVGSGSVESSCNTLLNLRTKRNAEHWSNSGLRGVLTLRGVHRSSRFETFWPHLAKRYRARVVAIEKAA